MRWLFLAFLLFVASPVWAVDDVYFGNPTTLEVQVNGLLNTGSQIAIPASLIEVKFSCSTSNSGATITVDETDPNWSWTHIGTSMARFTFDAPGQGIGGTLGEVCAYWIEGVGDVEGRIASNKSFVRSGSRTVSGAVVSSGDCTNSATLFDTDLTVYYAGTNGPREAGIQFIDGPLANEVRRIGGYNTNGCITVNQAFSGTPVAGNRFIIVKD